MKILDCQGSIKAQKMCLITSKVKPVQVMMEIIQNRDNFGMKIGIKSPNKNDYLSLELKLSRVIKKEEKSSIKTLIYLKRSCEQRH